MSSYKAYMYFSCKEILEMIETNKHNLLEIFYRYPHVSNKYQHLLLARRIKSDLHKLQKAYEMKQKNKQNIFN